MALATWPAINDAPMVDGFQVTPWSAAAIVTEMEGGNARSRRRPGDSVTTIQQTIAMKDAELEIFKSWFKNTIAGGAARFRMDVWTGTAFENKVCQFDLKNPLTYLFVAQNRTKVGMTLRVYEV